MAVAQRSELIDKNAQATNADVVMPDLVPGIRCGQRRAVISPGITRRWPLRVTSGQEIEPVLEPKLARDAALNFAAGRLRQRARNG